MRTWKWEWQFACGHWGGARVLEKSRVQLGDWGRCGACGEEREIIEPRGWGA